MRRRLSELLDLAVVDEAGHDLGVVHEVHLVQDGPQATGLDQALQLHGLYAGPGGLARRLGYVRGVIERPRVVRFLLSSGTVRYVPWERVRRVGETVVVAGDGTDLGPTSPGGRR